MARFIARKVKKGQFEIAGLDKYVGALVARLVKAVRPASKKAAQAVEGAIPAALLEALERHPRKAQLLRAGKRKDQLLRSLIPLYLARKTSLRLTSGAISRFWAEHGVRFAPPNAAKALRQHVGYARLDAKSRQITPNGIRYVESALATAHRTAA